MKTSLRLLAGLLLAGLAGSLPAAISVTRLEGFNKSWQFINTDPTYTKFESFPGGYYKDYNGDGLPDYLVCLKSAAGAMRAFTLNTAATGGDKTYANKTAGRDFAATPGVYNPQRLYTPRAPKSDTPDLVLQSDNRGGTNGFDWTALTFERLNKANTAWPTEKQWTITMPFKAKWVVQWPEYSYDGDDYPDFFIYNAQAPSDNRRFVLGLYSGQTGAPIWQRTLNLDPGDTWPGMSGFSGSSIVINPIDLLPVGRIGGGDFDNDGKPEFLLYYTYSKMNSQTYAFTYNTMVKVLDSKGMPLPPYGAGWTRLGPADLAGPLLSACRADLDKDGYRDLVLISPHQMLPPAGPVFMGYSLKKNQVLFQSINSDFGSTDEDASEFQTMEAWDASRAAPIDLTGDGKIDLTVFRDKSDAGPLEIGLFHGVGGAGRKVWLSSPTAFANFDRVHMVANDFNYDNILDFVLIKNPSTPATPAWTIANTALKGSGITLGKQFTYTSSAKGVQGANQDFTANSTTIGSIGDMDGNGQRDTWAGFFWELAASGVTQQAGGSLIVYNTPPPSSTAPASYFAALDLLVTGQDWFGAPMIRTARNLNDYSYVDNDGDKISDDVVAWWDNAVFALNFKTKGIYPAAGQTTTPTPANGGSVAVGQPLRWEAPDGAYGDGSFEVYLGTSQTAVAAATHASPEYQGNLGYIASYLPRPALTAGATYYWRVDSVSPWGQVTKGTVWRLGASPAGTTATNAIRGSKWELFR